jgi:hypothetical protein
MYLTPPLLERAQKLVPQSVVVLDSWLDLA